MRPTVGSGSRGTKLTCLELTSISGSCLVGSWIRLYSTGRRLSTTAFHANAWTPGWIPETPVVATKERICFYAFCRMMLLGSSSGSTVIQSGHVPVLFAVYPRGILARRLSKLVFPLLGHPPGCRTALPATTTTPTCRHDGIPLHPQCLVSLKLSLKMIPKWRAQKVYALSSKHQ